MERRAFQVNFQTTGDMRMPWEASVEGERWQVQLNELPEAAYLYSLLVNGVVVEQFQNWPPNWGRLPSPQTTREMAETTDEVDLYLKRDYEIEAETFERARHLGPSRLVDSAAAASRASKRKRTRQPKNNADQETSEYASDSAAPATEVWWKSVDQLFAAVDRANVKDLAKAMRQAALSGKEPFSLARLEEVLGEAQGSWAESEASLRLSYYIRHSGLRTLAEFAALLREQQQWE